MATTIDVVEFQLGREHYALDIQLAREIVEMMPITPLPRSPGYIAGIINLRGEITNILNLNALLGLHDGENPENRKIIVLVPEAAGGSNVGIIVDDVSSVRQVNDRDIDTMDDAASNAAYVKGIIKLGVEDEGDGRETDRTDLIIWLDIRRLLREQVATA
ncbi:purine-binding chemotaxis protein CheW [Methanoculleus sp. FWC-SCC1]|uniref:Purine-binding chemotaxis protein CheW n=1 Tax=Methanoculleus frigidifontis TaxID=2584085 RepID=A0ABT8M758_9EURY|nr:chemotaxis protein CheW [Methanoculleus sp. FWC-SCC1]MDN7023767.1 purine-binding chemotaxis protein CheW [Methanoculleus sp. FWC-SCC1]